MTREEILAFEYGLTFDVKLVPDGYAVAPCFDSRMDALVHNARSNRGIERNIRNMTAWNWGRSLAEIKSVLDAHGVPNFIADGRIYADSMIAHTSPFEEIEDLTDYTRAELFAWLGY